MQNITKNMTPYIANNISIFNGIFEITTSTISGTIDKAKFIIAYTDFVTVYKYLGTYTLFINPAVITIEASEALHTSEK